MNPTFAEVFEALRPSYQSVEVRSVIVAVGDKKGWYSLGTSIRFSSASRQAVARHHQDLVKLWELGRPLLKADLNKHPDYSGLNIDLAVFQISDFHDIVFYLDQGSIRSSQKRCYRTLEDGIKNLDAEQVYLTTTTPGKAAFRRGWEQRNTELPGTVEPVNPSTRQRMNDRALYDWARNARFSDIDHLFCQVLGGSLQDSNRLEIILPTNAWIERVEDTGTEIKVQCRAHKDLDSLFVGCSMTGNSPGYGNQPPIELSRQALKNGTAAKGMVIYDAIFPLAYRPPSGTAEVALFKGKPRRLNLAAHRTALRSGVPGFQGFTAFVPESDLNEYLEALAKGLPIKKCRLFSKFRPNDKTKAASQVFEHVVTYLLALAELNPVLLSNPGYDCIDNGEGGSADILCIPTYENILVVSCTTAMPDTKKRGLLASARATVADRLGSSPERVSTVLVTSKPKKSKVDNGETELDASDLLNIWRGIQNGKLAAVRRHLGYKAEIPSQPLG